MYLGDNWFVYHDGEKQLLEITEFIFDIFHSAVKRLF